MGNCTRKKVKDPTEIKPPTEHKNPEYSRSYRKRTVSSDRPLPPKTPPSIPSQNSAFTAVRPGIPAGMATMMILKNDF